jgi:glyoxylase-like metal-dependent hydrolase (beta-lactamase superfamily II)
MTASVTHAPASDRLAVEVEPGVFQLDHHFRGSPGVIASYLLADGDALTLVEAGPASTTETLFAGVRQAGFDPAAIERIVVTHIHLDHAGAAGTLLRRLPRARLYVHPLGAPHLLNPTKLIASATRIYGDQMGPLWGEMLPVPEDRLTVLEDGGAVGGGETGSHELRAHFTPGHAYHHLALHDPARGALFTGDATGLRLDGTCHVRPATPPPEFDPERWQESIVTMRALAPRRLYLTHFGAYDDASWHFEELLERTWFWAGWVSGRLSTGEAPAAASEALREIEDSVLARVAPEDETLVRRYEEAGSYRMSTDGIARWWKKRQESRD